MYMGILTNMKEILTLAALVLLLIAAFGLLRKRGALTIIGMKEMWSAISRRKLLIGLLTIIYLASICAGAYTRNSSHPTLLVKMNYEEAAEGLNPNKTHFNSSKILSNEILSQVIAEGGLNITVEELSEGLSIQSAFDESKIKADGNLRIATQYKVNSSPKLLKLGVDPVAVIDLLAKVYKDAFLGDYTENNSILELSFEDMQDADYLDTVDYLEVKAQKLKHLISVYSYESPAYRISESGETFSSLAKKIENFINLDLDRYHAFILENGLSKASSQYLTQMDYENLLLDVDYQTYLAAYNVRLEAINIYDEQMAQIVLVPSTDMQQRFYMSRTRIGVDDFADEADTALEESTKVRTEVLHNSYAKAQVGASVAQEQLYAKADAMLAQLKTELEALSGQASAITESFISEKRNGYLTISVEEKSATDLMDLRSSLLMTACFTVGLSLTVGAFSRPGKKKAR